MNRIYLLLFLLSIFLSSGVRAQVVPTVLVQYDNAGNRILRKIETMCPNCPEPEPPGNSSVSPGDEGSMFRRSGNHDPAKDMGKVRLYPNPFDAELTVQHTGWEKGIRAHVKVFDVTGKMVLAHEISGAVEILHFTNMASGTYMVYYYDGDQLQKTWKVTKNSAR